MPSFVGRLKVDYSTHLFVAAAFVCWNFLLLLSLKKWKIVKGKRDGYNDRARRTPFLRAEALFYIFTVRGVNGCRISSLIYSHQVPLFAGKSRIRSFYDLNFQAECSESHVTSQIYLRLSFYLIVSSNYFEFENGVITTLKRRSISSLIFTRFYR